VDALDSSLFYNATIKKRLSAKDAKDVIDYMMSKEGEERAEWIGLQKAAAWIWWRKPEEWAALLAHWVNDMGQKGTVLTLYELVEGEATEKQEFHGLDVDVLQKSLNTLVKVGKAQVFGNDDQQGVKFF
jgi:ESCRT-II complex subunit VPS25